MKLTLLLLVAVPILWLIGLLYYLLTWIDWDKTHRYIAK
jgi:hypothetical protein